MGEISNSSPYGTTEHSLLYKRPRAFLFLVVGTILVISYIFHRTESKVRQVHLLVQKGLDFGVKRSPRKDSLLFPDFKEEIWSTKDGIPYPRRMEGGQRDEEVKCIIARLDRMMPHLSFTNISTTTSARNSRASLLNPKDAYCTGEQLLVQLDLHDRAGRRKMYGGDFLRVRISSSANQAGASGLIKDYGNGTYLVNFTLFWEGTIKVSLLLFHPSEGVSALWTARKKGYDKITFIGKFLNGTSEVLTECGLAMNTTGQLCEYVDERDKEVFYCMKPANVPCEAFVELRSQSTPISYLTPLEKRLFERTNVAVEIPRTFGEIRVTVCANKRMALKEKCKLGMDLSSPSGYVWENQWYPVRCNMSHINMVNQLNTCLKNKLIYLMGDSTLQQWMEYFTKTLKGLKSLHSHGYGKHQNLFVVDVSENIQIHWERQGNPFVSARSYSVKDHSYIARKIDSVAGEKDTVVVVTLGQHFRPFPIELFIRRMINIREAIKRLLLRSPETKVIIKSENIREIGTDHERFGDFHGYTQMLAVKDIFQGLNVGFIDAWDMTIAYGTLIIHPPAHVIRSQINMFLSYIS